MDVKIILDNRFKYLIVFFFSAVLIRSQNTRSISESLSKLSKKNVQDTTRIDLYLALASEYTSYKNDSSFYYLELAEDLLKKYPRAGDNADAKYLRSIAYYAISEFDKAQWSLNQAIKLSLELDNKKLLAKSYNLLGAIQFNLGNYSEAIKNYNRKLEIVQLLGDTISIIETYYNISLINNAEGSYFKSLENNYTALGLSEKIKDSVSMMIVYEGLGISYSKINDFKKAVINLKKALQLAINFGKIYEEAGIWVDLGNVYQQNNEEEKALYYFKRGEEAARRNGDKLVESIAISCKGVSLMKLQKYKEAIDLFETASGIDSNISYRKGVAENQLHIAECNLELGKVLQARGPALNSLSEAKLLGEKKLEADAWHSLSKIFGKLNNTDSAYLCFKKYVIVSDTINSRTAMRKITEMESGLEKAEMYERRQYEEKLAELELSKQRQIKNIILGASGMIMLLLIFSYRNYRQKKKASIEITEKRKIIEHKNKDILDSINYSKRLQEAVLLSGAEVKQILPASSLVYLPKEIVSGDFYFIEKDEKGRTHIIVAESNKHGVPGAFISIAGNNVLKQAIKEKSGVGPGEVLGFLDHEIRLFLKGHENTGLNLAYCIIESDQNKFSYAGANLPVWLISKKEFNVPSLIFGTSKKLYEIQTDNGAIGIMPSVIFNSVDFEAEKDDILILFTNGFINQQNSEHAEFGKPRFTELMFKESSAEEIVNSFHKWKGKAEQNDDVCILCVKL